MTDIAMGSAEVLYRDGLIGTWRRFGACGPVYEILGPAEAARGAAMMRIRILETAEEINYRLVDLLADPSEI